MQGSGSYGVRVQRVLLEVFSDGVFCSRISPHVSRYPYVGVIVRHVNATSASLPPLCFYISMLIFMLGMVQLLIDSDAQCKKLLMVRRVRMEADAGPDDSLL